MRKILIVLAIVFITLPFFAQENEEYISEKIYAPIEQHNIQMFVTEIAGSNQIHITNKMTVKANNVPNYLKTAFFLSKDFVIEKISVDGFPVEIVKLSTFSATYFDGDLTVEQLEEIIQYCDLYEVEVPPFPLEQKEVEIEIKYSLVNYSQIKTVEVENNRYEFEGDLFWYPLYLSEKPNLINIEIRSLDNVAGAIDGMLPQVEEIDGIKRSSFMINSPSKNIDLIIQKN